MRFIALTLRARASVYRLDMQHNTYAMTFTYNIFFVIEHFYRKFASAFSFRSYSQCVGKYIKITEANQNTRM